MRLVIETGDGQNTGVLAPLLALARLPESQLSVDDPVWTAERIDRLLTEVNGRARTLLRALADNSGDLDGEEFRAAYGDGALQGPTASLTKAVTRGVDEGWLPAGTEVPITRTYADRASRQHTSYHLPSRFAALLRAAFQRRDGGDPDAVRSQLAALFRDLDLPQDEAWDRADAFLDAHAADLAAWLAHRGAPRRTTYGDTST